MWGFDVPGKFGLSGNHSAFHAAYHPDLYAACPRAAEATGSSLYTTGTNTGSTAKASTCTAAICAAQTTGAAGDAETNGNYDTWVS